MSSGMSDSSATTLDQPTTSASSLSDPTATTDSTVSSDDIVIDASSFSSSFTSEILDDTTTFGPSTTTTDTIKILTDATTSADTAVLSDTTAPADTGGINASTGSDAPHGATVSTGLTTSIEKTTTTDTATSAQSTPAEIVDTTETIVATETTASMDVTTTEFTTISALDSASTMESLWASTTAVSCPVYSNLLDDPSFEGEIPTPTNGNIQASQLYPTKNKVVPLKKCPGLILVISLCSLYQIWVTYAAISDPDEDWDFSFIIGTTAGKAFTKMVNVPKGSPFVYRQESTIFQGRTNDGIATYMRASMGSKPRSVAIDDVYVAEYVPSYVVPIAKTGLCGGIRGNPASVAQPYRTVNLDQGNEEICAQLCARDESCVTFGWQVEPNFRACTLFKYTQDQLGIAIRDRGRVFYDRSCWQCTGLECLPS
ncbi:hypothetical protein NXS19_003709 [Fusarium pseudograminearum]|nr:hypothetical protein NXS19_003709 [Fusarium pseudograminearum]